MAIEGYPLSFRDPRLFVMTASYFCLVVGIIGVALWLPQILKQRGLTTMQTGFASALNGSKKWE